MHLTYQTAFVDQDGKLQLRDDVYGRDARMIAILKGSERKVADIAIERPPNTVGEAGEHAGRHVWRQDGGYSSGPNFFDMLFGGGRALLEPPGYRPRGFVGPRYARTTRVYPLH